MIRDFPWLQPKDFNPPKRQRTQEPSADGEVPGDAVSDHGQEEEAEDEAELEVDNASDPEVVDPDEVADELRDLRSEWGIDPRSEVYFYHRILGGHWTRTHKGVTADGVAAFPRQGLAMEWSRRFRWPRQFGCIYSAHGVEDSHRIIQEFIRRPTHFFSMWLSAGKPALQEFH